MSNPRRILFATFGSAGDLFPLIPIARQLLSSGHEVMFAAPRSLGLYLRTIGMPTFAVGGGAEVSFVRDARLLTTRWSGRASQRRVFMKYVLPTLAEDTERIGRLLDDWTPEVVVTMNFAVAARIAALRAEVAHIGCSIYPQFFDPAGRYATAFAKPFLDNVADLAGPAPIRQYGMDLVALGVDHSGILLHDPVLLQCSDHQDLPEAVGYPYFDAVPTGATGAVGAWLDASSTDVVVITLGSFLGLAPRTIWDSVASAIRRCGVRALVVNARGAMRSTADGSLLAVGYLPMSEILERAAAVVHHGGIGTSFGAIRSGVPSVVVPQAFDQPFNARLIERAGVGLEANSDTLGERLELVLSSPTMSSRAASAAKQLIGCADAAQTAANSIIRRVSNLESLASPRIV